MNEIKNQFDEGFDVVFYSLLIFFSHLERGPTDAFLAEICAQY